jgi:hypothetical protein
MCYMCYTLHTVYSIYYISLQSVCGALALNLYAHDLSDDSVSHPKNSTLGLKDREIQKRKSRISYDRIAIHSLYKLHIIIIYCTQYINAISV